MTDTRTAYRTCPLCEASCGLEITVRGREVTRIRGDREDVFSHGFVCPKGSTLKVSMHYDNSTANRFNPDPTATVRWGDQTWEEMMLGYYGTIELPGSTATRSRR